MNARVIPQSPEIAIRTYRAGDERALVELFETVFGKRISEAHWRWKLAQPAPVAAVWLATHLDRPVFQYAGMHVPFNLRDRTTQIMVSVDTMTAPDFRRRGLLTEVASRAYTAWREAHIAFVIGLPNEQWGSRTHALGWQPLFPLQWLAHPLRPEVLLGRRLGLSSSVKHLRVVGDTWSRLASRRLQRDDGIEVLQVTRAGEAFDRIWQRCKMDAAFSSVRDAAWVERRFMSSPMRHYQVLLAYRNGVPTAYLAYSLIQTADRTSAQLAEILAPRDDAASGAALLVELLRRLRDADADLVRTLAVPGTTSFDWLRRAGFLRGPAFSVQVVPLAEDLPLAAMRDPLLWRLSGADFDVV